MAALPAILCPTLAKRRAVLATASRAVPPDTPQMGREHGRFNCAPFTRTAIMLTIASMKPYTGKLLPVKEKGPAFQPVPIYNPIVTVRLTRLPPPPGGPK